MQIRPCQRGAGARRCYFLFAAAAFARSVALSFGFAGGAAAGAAAAGFAAGAGAPGFSTGLPAILGEKSRLIRSPSLSEYVSRTLVIVGSAFLKASTSFGSYFL